MNLQALEIGAVFLKQLSFISFDRVAINSDLPTDEKDFQTKIPAKHLGGRSLASPLLAAPMFTSEVKLFM